MKEEQLIQKYPLPVTKEDLIRDFKAIGLVKGDIVLVHSSLSSIGWVVGKEIAVIEALLEVVGKEGTILMPSQSGDWSNPDDWCQPPVPENWRQIIKDHMPSFDPLTTPTRMMGRIADAFWRYPNSIRSNHPQVSFSGNGKMAHDILEHHPLEYGLSMSGPLGKMYEKEIKILLIGVGYGNCTALHLSECLSNKTSKVTLATKLNEKWVEYVDYDYDDSDFERIGLDFEKEHKVSIHTIGYATGKCIDLKEIVNFGILWMKENR